MRHAIRLFLFLLLAVVIVALAVFAVSNRAPVAVSFWPLPWEPQLPLYLAVLGAGAAGLLAGGAVCGWSRARLWLRARSAERRAARLEGRAGGPTAGTGVPAAPAGRSDAAPARLRTAITDN